MVYHPILVVEASESVPAVGTVYFDVLVAQSETHITYDDIIALNAARVVGHTDSVARGCLTGNGRIVPDFQF